MQYLAFYSQYIDLRNPKDSGFTDCKCPLCSDKGGSAGVDLSTGVFQCFQCGTKCSPTKFLQKIDSNTTPEIASLVVNDYRLQNKVIKHEENATFSAPFRSRKFVELYEESQKHSFEDVEFVKEYAEEHGLSMETLKKAGLGFLPAEHTNWKKDSLVFPYWLGGQVVGLRYRDDQGNKIWETNSHYTLWGLEQLSDDDVVVCITEGESDKLRLMQETDYKVLSCPGIAFRKEWDRELSGIAKVILVPQADEASSKLVSSAKVTLGDRLRLFWLPWKRGQIGKDLCQWLIYNTSDELRGHLRGMTFERYHSHVMSAEEFSSFARTEGKSVPVIKGLFNHGELAIIGGPAKSMKTWLAINMMRTILCPDETFADLPGLYGSTEDQRILLIEEEGNAEELWKRFDTVMTGVDLRNRVFFAHKMGLKLDNEEDFQKIVNAIEKHKITGVFTDPYQRVTSGEENSASESRIFWDNMHRLSGMFPKLWALILHHFSRDAKASDMWKALRGSSRMEGEVDLGLFQEKRPRTEGLGIKLFIDGRNIPPMEAPDGKDCFRLRFDNTTGRLIYDSAVVTINKHLSLLEELKDRREWEVDDAAKFYDCNRRTIMRWLAKLGDQVEIRPPANGRNAVLVFRHALTSDTP